MQPQVASSPLSPYARLIRTFSWWLMNSSTLFKEDIRTAHSLKGFLAGVLSEPKGIQNSSPSLRYLHLNSSKFHKLGHSFTLVNTSSQIKEYLASRQHFRLLQLLHGIHLSCCFCSAQIYLQIAINPLSSDNHQYLLRQHRKVKRHPSLEVTFSITASQRD